MGKKAGKKKIRSVKIYLDKEDYKSLREMAEVVGCDSVEEYVEDAVERIYCSDYNMLKKLFEERLARMNEKARDILERLEDEVSNKDSDEAEEEEAEDEDEEEDEAEESEEEESEETAEAEEAEEPVKAEVHEEAAPVKEAARKTARRAKKEEKVEEAAEAPAEKTEA